MPILFLAIAINLLIFIESKSLVYKALNFTPLSTVVQYQISSDSTTIIYVDANSIIYKIVNDGVSLTEVASFVCSPYQILPQRMIIINSNGTLVSLVGTQTILWLEVGPTNFSLKFNYNFGQMTGGTICFNDFKKAYVQNRLAPYDIDIYRVTPAGDGLYKAETLSKDGQKYGMKRTTEESRHLVFMTPHTPMRMYVEIEDPVLRIFQQNMIITHPKLVTPGCLISI